MKNKINLLLVVIAIFTGLISVGWTVSAQKTNSAKQMWGYKVVTVYSTNDLPQADLEQLNQLGTEGWELVTILHEKFDRNGSQQHKAEYYFKRAK